MSTPVTCPLCSGPTEEHEQYRDLACPACGLAGPRDVLERIAKMRADLEQERVRHAACGAAARGYGHTPEPLAHGSYGWSDAVQAVIDLYAAKQVFAAEVARLRADLKATEAHAIDCEGSVEELVAEKAELQRSYEALHREADADARLAAEDRALGRKIADERDAALAEVARLKQPAVVLPVRELAAIAWSHYKRQRPALVEWTLLSGEQKDAFATGIAAALQAHDAHIASRNNMEAEAFAAEERRRG